MLFARMDLSAARASELSSWRSYASTNAGASSAVAEQVRSRIQHRREEAIPRFKAAILRETNGKGASYILMRRVDTLGRTLNPMDLYTGPWERAGYPPFYLNKLEKQ